ncbi:MAG: fibronectin type III domain-containing protein [Candidatus Eisenbacteria bacterium]
MLSTRFALIVLALLLTPFILTGCSSDSNSPILEPEDTVPPMAPSLSHVRATGTTAVLTWYPNTEADLAGYSIYMYDPSPQTLTTYVKKNASLVRGSAYLVQGLTAGSTYYFKLTATDRTGNESLACQPFTVLVYGQLNDDLENGFDKPMEREEY